MKHIKVIIVMILLICLEVLYAQESPTAAGGEATGAGATVSYSVGQVMYTYKTSSNFNVAEGVQQPYETSIVLPIKLLNFAVKLKKKKRSVLLNWQTVSEINNDFFTIERSKNGYDWQGISSVIAVGNSSSLQSYSATDNKPYSGLSYYRLKQTDFDGQFEHSQMKSVNIFGIDNFQIFPNPTNNQITIIGNENELAEIIVYNSLGQDVTTLTLKVLKKEHELLIDLSNLKVGIYYIKTKTTTNKVSKQ
tara:strand:- start:1285 stop:2031 length:747 start_codon:yes stop_codon:yes gene_type:complete